MNQAACVPLGPRFTNRPVRAQLAVCESCPVTAACLAWAVRTRATGVVMGGRQIGVHPLVWRGDRR
ncbi:WhiB family transcriptional regulator [Enemella evansiae]